MRCPRSLFGLNVVSFSLPFHACLPPHYQSRYLKSIMFHQLTILRIKQLCVQQLFFVLFLLLKCICCIIYYYYIINIKIFCKFFSYLLLLLINDYEYSCTVTSSYTCSWSLQRRYCVLWVIVTHWSEELRSLEICSVLCHTCNLRIATCIRSSLQESVDV